MTLFSIKVSKRQYQEKNVDGVKLATRNWICYLLKEDIISKSKYFIVKNIVKSFFSYTLTSVEKYALLFSLDQHTPTKNNTKHYKIFFLSHTKTYIES